MGMVAVDFVCIAVAGIAYRKPFLVLTAPIGPAGHKAAARQ
jgi:hypothetical protein